jgi:hypothetical protein
MKGLVRGAGKSVAALCSAWTGEDARPSMNGLALLTSALLCYFD